MRDATVKTDGENLRFIKFEMPSGWNEVIGVRVLKGKLCIYASRDLVKEKEHYVVQ